MLRMVSKSADPPAVVCWSMRFLQDSLNGTVSMGQPVRSYISLSGSLLFRQSDADHHIESKNRMQRGLQEC